MPATMARKVRDNRMRYPSASVANNVTGIRDGGKKLSEASSTMPTSHAANTRAEMTTQAAVATHRPAARGCRYISRPSAASKRLIARYPEGARASWRRSLLIDLTNFCGRRSPAEPSGADERQNRQNGHHGLVLSFRLVACASGRPCIAY